MAKQDILIKRSNLPMRSPVSTALLWLLLLDHYKAPDWLWGVAGTIIALYIIVWQYQIHTAKWVSVETLLQIED